MAKQSPLFWGGLIGLAWLLFGGSSKARTTPGPLLIPTLDQSDPTTQPQPDPGQPPAEKSFIKPVTGLTFIGPGTAQTIGFIGTPSNKPPPKELTSTQFFFYLETHPELLNGGLTVSIDSYPTYHALATLLALVLLDMVAVKPNPKMKLVKQFFVTSRFFLSSGMIDLIAESIQPLIGKTLGKAGLDFPRDVAKPVMENYTTGQERIYRGNSLEFIKNEAIPNACGFGKVAGDAAWLVELAAIRAGQLIVLQAINPEQARQELNNATATIGTIAKVVGMAASKIPAAGILIQVVAGFIEGIVAMFQAGESQKKLENATAEASNILTTSLLGLGFTWNELPSRRMQLLIEGQNYFASSQIWRTLIAMRPYVATRATALQIPYFYHQIPWSIPYVLDARLETCKGIAYIGPIGAKDTMCHNTENPPLSTIT